MIDVSSCVDTYGSLVPVADSIDVQIGSANLNDRSQKGDGDSEIALVIEDTDEIESMMDGQQVRMLPRLLATNVPNTAVVVHGRAFCGQLPAEAV